MKTEIARISNSRFILLSLLFLGLISCGKLSSSFEASSRNVTVGESVSFTNNSECAESYEWSFGDGSTSAQESPSHTYASAGDYTVTLNAISGEDAESSSTTITVSGGSVALLTSFAPPAGTLYTETDITFVNTTTGASSYAWQFGDGNTSTLQNPTHQYTNAGNYEVTLTASNDTESKEQKVTITVEELPKPIVITNCNQFGDLQWTDHNPNGVDYIVDCDFEMREGELMIASNTTIEFGAGASLSIMENSSFTSEGQSNILFTGKVKEPGYWEGVQANSTGNFVMIGVTIEFAGKKSISINDISYSGSLILTGRSSSNKQNAIINQCVLRSSSGHGLVIGENVRGLFGLVINSRFENCLGAGVLTSLSNVGEILQNQTSESGFENAIYIYNSTDEVFLGSNYTFVQRKYYLAGSIIVYKDISINAGTEIVLGQNSIISIGETGSIKAVGTSDNKIIIRGEQDVRGWWNTIIVNSAKENKFEYCDIKNGGSIPQWPTRLPGTNIVIPKAGNVYIPTAGKLNFINSKISKSGGCGIVRFNGILVEVTSTFSDNAEGDICY